MKESTLYKILRPIIKLFVLIVFHPKVIGKENIPKNKVLFAGNHTNNLDCIILMSIVNKPLHFLAKKEIFEGISGIIFKHMGLIPVDRKNKNDNAIKTAIEYLNNDMNVLIFPEGTTEKGRGLLEFKFGAVKIAKEAKCKIVPFVITGKFRPFINDLKVEFLSEFEVKDTLVVENSNLRELIKNKVEG